MALPIGPQPPPPMGLRPPVGVPANAAPLPPLKKKKKPDVMPPSMQGLRSAALGPPKVMG